MKKLKGGFELKLTLDFEAKYNTNNNILQTQNVVFEVYLVD